MQDLINLLAEKGFDFQPDFSGRVLRADRSGTLSAWFQGREILLNNGSVIQAARFGDWKSDEKYSWESGFDQSKLSAEEILEIQTKQKEAQQREIEEKKIRQEQASVECSLFFQNQTEVGTSHPYFEKKSLGHLSPLQFGLRLGVDDSQPLIIPLRDVNNKLWNLQKIDATGLKQFYPGGKIAGNFHDLRANVHMAGSAFLCEGIATGISISEALKDYDVAIIVCFNASNLPKVAQQLRNHYSGLKFTICVDNDWRLPLRNPPLENVGLKYGTQAAKIAQGLISVPIVKEGSDFNDMMVEKGLEAVRKAVLIDSREPGAGVRGPEKRAARDNIASDLGPLEIITKQGPGNVIKPQLPSEARVVKHLLDYFGDNIVKQERDLFLYTGTHWRFLTTQDLDNIKKQIARICEGLAGVRHVDNCFKLFVYSCPAKPASVDMFKPHPYCANFLNGTLHVMKDAEYKRTLEFKPHSKLDYLVNVLPYEYDESRQAKNEEFLTMLERVFEGDADKSDKIRAVRQMYGACLVSAFPHLFMLHGKPGTGKSTVLNIACRLVSEENLCDVPPSQFQGFNMEGMAGKLVNCDTDIPFDAPMRDEIVKKIIDRKPFRIRRKGIKDLTAPIPAIHLFGGNGIPRALDSTSRAHDRRWTFLEFSKVVPKSGTYKQDYWDWCFEQSPQGVLNFAIEGLEDLCQEKGIFTDPESSKKKKEEWQQENDPVEQFLKDCESGEYLDQNTKLTRRVGDRIKRSHAWVVYSNWYKESYKQDCRDGKVKFFAAMHEKGFYAHKNKDGVFELVGFGTGTASDSQF